MSASDGAGGGDQAATSRAVREPADLRLLPIVAGVWAGELGVLQLQPARPGQWATGAGALLVVALGVAARSVRRPRARGSVRVAIAMVGVAIGLLAAAMHLARLHPAIVTAAIDEGAVVRATVRITGDPRSNPGDADPVASGDPVQQGAAGAPAAGGGEGSRDEDAGPGTRPRRRTWSVTARAEGLVVRGTVHSLRVPVELTGDAVAGLAHGSLVEVTARARAPWAPASHGADLAVLGAATLRSPPGRAASVTNDIRAAFRRACAGLPADAGALLLGLAVGDESTLPTALDEAMVRSGLSHLTAVSGSNTSLVVGIALAAAAGLGAGWRLRVTGALLVLLGYVALVRPQPSVLRAAAMGVVALVAVSTGGRRRGPPALLAACLVLLLVLPQMAVSMGFALSASATAGLLLVGPPLADRMARWRATRGLPEPLRAALAVAAAAHLATLPLAVSMGNGASLVALPANVVVTPAVPVATVVGLAAALLAPVAPVVAEGLAWLGVPATALIARVAHASAAVPHGVLPLPEGPFAGVATAGVLAAAALAARLVAQDRPRALRWVRRLATWPSGAALATAVILGGGTARTIDARWPPPGWLVLACDVGQGDALVLRAPGSADALLVDAGPDPGALAACLRDAEVDRLVVLLSHFHADHVDGLAAVLDDWPVEAVLTSWIAQPPGSARAVVTRATGAGVPVRTLRTGNVLDVAGMRVTVLWPGRALADSPENNASVVAVVQVPTGGGVLRVLLTGDVEPEAQSILVAQPSPVVHVVKVPHHGSVHQSPAFAGWTGARLALVTVGRDNDHGHPAGRTLAQYEQVGATIGRTDTDRGLAVVLGPAGPELRTQR